MTVVWKDPPLKEWSWRARLEPLIEKPETWALVHVAPTEVTARNTAYRLSNRVYRVPNPEDRWEFEHRGTEVYARYLGVKESTATREVVA